jgi:hypothetical protein
MIVKGASNSLIYIKAQECPAAAAPPQVRGFLLCAAAGFACDRILFYGTAGGAFGNLQASSGTLPFSSTTQVGWTAGAGIEAAISPNWTAKIAIVVATISELPYPGADLFDMCTHALVLVPFQPAPEQSSGFGRWARS